MKKTITQLYNLKSTILALMLFCSILITKGQLTSPSPYCFPQALNMSQGTCTGNYGFNLNGFKLGTINLDLTGQCYGSTSSDVYRYWNSMSTNLEAGATYTATIISPQGAGYTVGHGFWIDLNRDNTFQSNELMGNRLVSNNNTTGGNISNITFTVPCNVTPGTSRLRVRCQYYANVAGGEACQTPQNYGESWDFNVSLNLPTSVSANFVAPTDAWVKSVVTFINNNQTGYIEHAWDVDNNGSYEQRSSAPNFSTKSGNSGTWTTAGTKCLKLRSTNCLGRDSIVKCLTLKAPTAVPVVDFVSNKTTIAQYESVILSDLSLNGPYEWTWDVYDSTTYINDPDADYAVPRLDEGVYDDPFGTGGNRNSQKPEFAFDYPGVYTVVLTARNDVGASVPTRKVFYITVTLPTDYLLGYGPIGPNLDNVVGSPSGKIYDDGGTGLNYSNNQGLGTRSFLLITPCNAQRIDLKMSQIKLKDANDKLRVWDGKSPGGAGTTLLASWNSNSRAPQTVSAFSGSMYILFESDGSGVDSGYIGSYTSQLGPATVSSPDFEPTTTPSYENVPVKFTNTTSNIVGVPAWEWSVDGDPLGNKKDFSYTFTSGGSYEVCATQKSCVGTAKTCKTIDVVTPQSQNSLDIVASTRRPKANVDLVALKPISDVANRFEWTIFPTTYTLMNPPTAGNGTSGAGFVNYTFTPGDSIPKPVIKFGASGCYTITLKAWNNTNQSGTVKTVVKNRFICAVDYCQPTSLILSSDVGINQVKLMDGTTELINNFSTSGDVAFTDYTSTETATVTFGKTYTLEVARVSNVDPANRKGWIDWNIDGDFDDAGEQIFIEASSYNKTLTTTFTVPEINNAFEGTTRMRIASNYNTQNTTACGPLTAGEVEDYAIVLANDNMPPVITLLGDATVRIEVGTSYTDAGATAFDASEGDITSRIVTTNDLDIAVTGIYTYEYNVIDKSNNKAVTVVRTIIVVNDLTKPVMTLNPGSTGCIEADRTNAPYVDPGATATDNKAPFNLNSSIVVTGSVDTRTVGNYTLTYYVQDVAGNNVTLTRNVCVEDTKAPVIDPLGSENIQINSVWVDQTTVFDAYDDMPVLTKTWGYNGILNTTVRGTYPVTYIAEDAEGNISAPKIRNYRVDDYIAPEIVLNTFDVVYHEVRTNYSSIFPNAKDNYYSASQVSLVLISSNVNENVTGTYSEVYEAIDGSGNTTRKTRTVIVRDTKSPRMWAPIMKACVGTNIWPMHGIQITDNYDAPSALLPRVEVLNQNVNIHQAGLYTITYRVVDLSGNVSEEFTRMVEYTYWPECTNSYGIEDLAANEENVKVYPNPSTGLVNLDLNGAIAQTATIEVYNAMGQKVMMNNYTEASKFEIDLSAYAKGIYTIKLIAEGQVINKRVVIQ